VSVAAPDVSDTVVFVSSGGERYIFYIGGGEQAIAIAKLLAK
jgi:hypothetical protein